MASGTPLSVERISGKPNVHLYTDTSGTAAYYKGDLVLVDGSGTLVIAAAGDATNSAGILGIAMADSPASTTTSVPVDVITDDGSTFVMKSTDTTSVSGNGQQHAITFTAGAHTCAISNTNESCVQIGLWDPAGSTKARIIVKFLPKVLQASVGF